MDAYAMHATGYLLKPISYKKLLSEIEYALGQAGSGADNAAPKTSLKVRVETFGYFNILVDGKPVVFKRSKAKGLMRVVPEKFDCDLYRFLSKDKEAMESFRGEYMSSYSWASATEGYLTEKE